MMSPCKWITDQAGPLVCRKGQNGYSWSICATAAGCPTALPRPIMRPPTTATAQPSSSAPQRCLIWPAPRAAPGSALTYAHPAGLDHHDHPGTFASTEPAATGSPNRQPARALAPAEGPPQ